MKNLILTYGDKGGVGKNIVARVLAETLKGPDSTGKWRDLYA